MPHSTERMAIVLPDKSWTESEPIRVDFGGYTDRGTTRRENEDNYLIAEMWQVSSVRQSSLGDSPLPTSRLGEHLLAVADGMGAHDHGEVASRVAIESLREFMSSSSERAPAARLEAAIRYAEAKVVAIGGAGQRRPGTTLTVALLQWPNVHIAHVGDSRAYLIRAGEARQLTDDHTLANAMRRNPEKFSASGQDAARYEHVLLNAIGGDGEPARIDLAHFPLQIGDTLLLCSDGLVSKVTDEEIAALAGRQSAASLSEGLTQLAVARGVRDNVTVANLRLDYAAARPVGGSPRRH